MVRSDIGDGAFVVERVPNDTTVSVFFYLIKYEIVPNSGQIFFFRT